MGRELNNNGEKYVFPNQYTQFKPMDASRRKTNLWTFSSCCCFNFRDAFDPLHPLYIWKYCIYH